MDVGWHTLNCSPKRYQEEKKKINKLANQPNVSCEMHDDIYNNAELRQILMYYDDLLRKTLN